MPLEPLFLGHASVSFTLTVDLLEQSNRGTRTPICSNHSKSDVYRNATSDLAYVLLSSTSKIVFC